MVFRFHTCHPTIKTRFAILIRVYRSIKQRAEIRFPLLESSFQLRFHPAFVQHYFHRYRAVSEMGHTHSTNRSPKFSIITLCPWKELSLNIKPSIMKTCLYNFDPIKPHFYIVKLRFTRVHIFFSYFC